MAAWMWLVLGGALLALEMMVQTEFWLATVGAAAGAVALLVVLGFGGPLWLQLSIFGVLAVVFSVFVRRRLHEQVIGRAPGIAPDLIDEHVLVGETIAPGATSNVTHRGSTWKARNVGGVPIEAGSRARVARVDGLTLELRA